MFIKLNISCFVNGLVYDESEKLLSCMDSVDITRMNTNDPDFREIQLFMTISRSFKCGFTIGGIMPFRKTTLLSVILSY